MSRHSDRIASLQGEEENESNVQPPPAENHEDAAEQEPPRRNKRKITRNLALIKFRKRTRNRQKLSVSIPRSHRRAVGDNSQCFITEAGVVVRHNAPIPTVSWKKMAPSYKQNMLKEMQQKFVIPIDAIADVMHQFNRQYNQWKHHLIKRFQSKRDEPPEGMSEDDWKELGEYFENDAKFKERSTKNKGNRRKLSARHRCGTKSFARVEMEMTEENDGVSPDAISYWKRTHQGEDGKWVDERAEEIMTRLEEAAQAHEETRQPGDAPLSLEEHLAQVIPPRVGYQGGRGWGPRPGNAILARQHNAANEELRAHNAQLENRIEELQAQVQQQNVRIHETSANIEEQVRAQVAAQLQAQVEAVLRLMRNPLPQNPPPQNPPPS